MRTRGRSIQSSPRGFHDSKKHRPLGVRFPQGFKIDGKGVYVPKIGWIGFRKSREIEGMPKNVSLSRDGRDWYVTASTWAWRDSRKFRMARLSSVLLAPYGAQSEVLRELAQGRDPRISGTVTSNNYNLVQQLAGATIVGTTTNNLTGSPNLGGSAATGGPTNTMKPNGGSLVIDYIPVANCAGITQDQRLAPRPDATQVFCDIGAYETP